THDQRSDDQPQRDSIRYFLKSLYHNFLVDGIDADADFVVSNRIEDLVGAARESFRKLLQVNDTGEEVGRRHALHDVALQDLVGAFANYGAGIERGIERVDDAIEIQERLGDHRELGRQPEPAIGSDARDFERDFAGVHLAENSVGVLGDKIGDSPVKILSIKTLLRLAHLNRRFGSNLAASFADRQH